MFDAQLMTGFSTSGTATVNEQVGPNELLAVTVVVPTGKNDPDGGLLLTVPQSPVIVFVKVTIAPHWPTAFVVTMFVGQMSEQGTTMMVKVQVVELLDVSIAVQVTV